jgi:hypothetical protein
MCSRADERCLFDRLNLLHSNALIYRYIWKTDVEVELDEVPVAAVVRLYRTIYKQPSLSLRLSHPTRMGICPQTPRIFEAP